MNGRKKSGHFQIQQHLFDYSQKGFAKTHSSGNQPFVKSPRDQKNPKYQSHLDVAVIVSGVTTVARVNQNGVEAVHDGVA